MQDNLHGAGQSDVYVQDMRDVYQRLGRTEVNVAALQSGMESLSRSTEAGFENLSTEIKNIANSIATSRPNFGAIAGVSISAIALTGALAGFALKSSVGPIERDILAIEKVIPMHRSLSDEKIRLTTDPLERRVYELERRLQVRMSDADARQDAEIKELQRKVFGPQ
jgi:hypothetical protein